MDEYFILLCIIVLAKGITTREVTTERRGSKSLGIIGDNLQVASAPTDQKEAATGLHGHDFDGLGHGHHGGYFQYAHNPDYGHYEFGYRRGNDHHFQERYEKAHDWKFKTKVKWGDKYGGYGEQYWDYNHVDKGHGGHGGGYDGGHGHGHDDGHYSEQIPVVSNPETTGRLKNERVVQKRESLKNTQMLGIKGVKLSLDPNTGKIMDELTGRTYWLQPTEEE